MRGESNMTVCSEYVLAVDFIIEANIASKVQ